VKGVIQALLSPLVLVVFFAGAPVTGLAVKAQEAAAAHFRVDPVRQLRKGVDAWPLIANPVTPAERRVNATLTLLNTGLQSSLRDCDNGARAEMRQIGAVETGQDPAADDWERKVKVTMTGPRFFSMVATDDTSCGEAHPNSDTIAMVFDMTTGTLVNWVDLVAKSAGATAGGDTAYDGTRIGALVLPAFQKINIAAANADCKDAFENPQSFLIWPDAKHGTLVAEAIGVPHVVQACAEEIPLTMEQARKLGFDESLVSAIEQAHARAVAAPKPRSNRNATTSLGRRLPVT
jgi:hypothetical protein